MTKNELTSRQCVLSKMNKHEETTTSGTLYDQGILGQNDFKSYLETKAGG